RSGMGAEGDREKFLDIIIGESQKLFELINAVIAMSRLEEKNRPEEYRVVDMEALVKDVIKNYEPDAKSKGIHLGFQPDRDNRLYTHPDLMRELIANLVDNAIVYNVDGGNVRIVLDGKADDKFVVTIQDTGIGISYDDQRRIFERFYMVDKSRSYNEKSTGLGLAIVKHNVDSLKGTIDVKSQLHHGSTFRLVFPKKGIYATK
ncbi:MAG: sensor histidine kinase, partial [Aedoeadaptatus pacaensis]